ncbi:phenylalanine--tRNA ligase subunit beta [Candidatus Saccharibacteria bacterium]|nr:phenylalanine--tRNA ligase subunit beta [Candidatus Saccharibacteria bacterium]
MKISLNWLKKYVDINVSNEELISLIGSRLVEVEGVIDETHKYDNIYIVRVESAEPIEGTHLSLCMINAGMAAIRGLPEVTTEDEGASPVTTGASDPSRESGHPALVQVVCGAPNVRAGMLAAWLAPGATVPASVHEDAPFVIGKRKMLGRYDSNGMLAGADELDFGDDHSGIVEIDPAMAKPGDKLADIFDLNDIVLEIENKSLTHRPDCFGIIGFAREVAGILGQKFEPSKLEESLSRSIFSDGENTERPSPVTTGARERSEKDDSSSLQIKISDPSLCPRYSALILKKHGELKKKYLSWQDTILSKSGMKPINPIVDATNYLMLLTGQPLHAFDYDKFIAVGKSEHPVIGVRAAKPKEKLELLDGQLVECTENDILITSNDTPVALAGAMGGMSTAIDENTRNIIIESATFSLFNMRKTQMAHGIFSEAITRFTKGQPAYQTLDVAKACASALSDGFEIAAMADAYPHPVEPSVVKITTDEINSFLGTTYTPDLITTTLKNVGFSVDANTMTFTAPLWRTDIHIKEDIIEEIGRLLGYDNITPTLPLHSTATKSPMLELKQNIRHFLSKYGGNEVLTYSFISDRLLNRATLNAKNSYEIVNSISPDLQFIRQSIVPSLLDKSYHNQKLPVDQFALFEMNQVYQKSWENDADGVPVAENHLAFVLAERKNTKTAFYQAKLYVDELLKHFGIVAEYVPLKSTDAVSKPFEPKRSAEIKIDDTIIGVVGEFKNSVRANFKLDPYLAGFEINLDEILAHQNPQKSIKNFTVKRKEDITITTTKSYAETLKELQAKYPDATITPLGIYQPEGSTEKNITYHLKFY